LPDGADPEEVDTPVDWGHSAGAPAQRGARPAPADRRTAAGYRALRGRRSGCPWGRVVTKRWRSCRGLPGRSRLG